MVRQQAKAAKMISKQFKRAARKIERQAAGRK
jgi:hypothetical protein